MSISKYQEYLKNIEEGRLEVKKSLKLATELEQELAEEFGKSRAIRDKISEKDRELQLRMQKSEDVKEKVMQIFQRQRWRKKVIHCNLSQEE